MRFTSFLPVAAAALIFGVASAADPAWDVPPQCAVSVIFAGLSVTLPFRAPPETSVGGRELTVSSPCR